jgi:hypothetical protein
MDALLFLSAIICLGLVVVWYVANERASAKGEKGFLAISPDKCEVKGPSYRMKKRGSGGGGKEREASAFAERSGGFRDKFEDGYKATGPLPRFGERPSKKPEEKPND